MSAFFVQISDGQGTAEAQELGPFRTEAAAARCADRIRRRFAREGRELFDFDGHPFSVSVLRLTHPSRWRAVAEEWVESAAEELT